MLYDPIPDPIAAGWTKEGDESHVPAGTSLQISDGTNAGFVRFFAVDPAAFTGEIELNPSVPLASGFSVDAEGSSGVHVAINDGERQGQATVLGTDGTGVRGARARHRLHAGLRAPHHPGLLADLRKRGSYWACTPAITRATARARRPST
jgi:hypothetical protein